MKAILVIDLDDSLMPLDEDTITLEKGTINYNDMNGNPFKITIEELKLKPMPKRKLVVFDPNDCDIEEEIKIEMNGYNRCIDEILGEEDE